MNKDMTKKEKILTITRFIIFTIVIVFIVLISIKTIPLIGDLSNEQSRLELKNKIGDMGIKGVITVLGLQILQIVVAVIPGQPVEIISGMLYGIIPGMLLCLIGSFIGTSIVFFAVRKIGTDFIQLFFETKKINQIRDSKIFKNTAKFEILLFIIFAIPLIPKDIFIYVGGISPVRGKRFLIISTVARIPSLFFTVYAGSSLFNGSFIITAILFSAFVLIGIIGIYATSIFRERLEKDS